MCDRERARMAPLRKLQPAFTSGIQQIIDRQTAEVVKQPAVDLKQGPQRVGQNEDKVYSGG